MEGSVQKGDRGEFSSREGKEDLERENARLNEKVAALQDMLERTTDYVDGLRKELAASKEAVERKNLYLEESIRFAATIQSGLLPDAASSTAFSDHFIFFRPKERIGGDLPFLFRSEDRTWVLMIDCSGHGVPGAMLTMTAHALIKDILENECPPVCPSELLEELNRQFFVQFTQDMESKDLEHGIDMACVLIPHEGEEAIFAGARRPLFNVGPDGEEREIAGSKRSIGERPGPEFRDERFPWKEGSSFYIFSDGFPDQFGGERDKKFKKRRLLDLLRSPYELSDLKGLLKDRFEEWKGDGDQTDDVLVMGFKK